MNDKVVLVKEIDNFKTVGETYEVANIAGDVVVLRDVKTKIAVGAVDVKTFNEYFSKVENVKGWTPWQYLTDSQGNVIAYYRTNQKRVQVRTHDNVRSETCCCNEDEFSLVFGIRLAMARCYVKARKKELARIQTNINDITKDIESVNGMIERMINSLG